METKAVINGDRIECAACGCRLFNYEIQPLPFLGQHGTASNILTEAMYSAEMSEKFKRGVKISIKCKHKDKGHACNTVNEILL